MKVSSQLRFISAPETDRSIPKSARLWEIRTTASDPTNPPAVLEPCRSHRLPQTLRFLTYCGMNTTMDRDPLASKYSRRLPSSVNRIHQLKVLETSILVTGTRSELEFSIVLDLISNTDIPKTFQLKPNSLRWSKKLSRILRLPHATSIQSDGNSVSPDLYRSVSRCLSFSDIADIFEAGNTDGRLNELHTEEKETME